MKPKTEELLYSLLWACEVITRPTFRNLTDSFEAWAYRNGFHRQLRTLEQQQLLESVQFDDGERLHRLTEVGRRLALGARDPVAEWGRPWDGKWRMVVFDVPQRRENDRARLRRSLARRGFGYLQNSVWITPNPLSGERDALSAGPVNVESLILLEASPGAGETNAQIVAGAWDFDAINANYDRHCQLLEREPKLRAMNATAAAQLQMWCREERLAWKETVSLDPLLPKLLHPTGYRGPKVWKLRLEVMTETGRRIRSFRASA